MKLEWICGKHLNDVARQVETPGKSTIFVARQIYFVKRHDLLVAWKLRNTMTVKFVDTARETFLV